MSSALIEYCNCSYEHQDIALNCGTMLRECARYEALAKIMLHSEDFFNFFRYVEVSTFDIASDAFSTFKVKVSLCVFKLGPMQFFLLNLCKELESCVLFLYLDLF